MPARSTAARPPIASAKDAVPERAGSRRGERRIPYRVPCRIRLFDPASGRTQTVVGETVNLSPRGVAMRVAVDAPLGTWVETLVPHPNGDPLFLCGRVVHVRRTLATNYELGVAILDESPPVF